MGRKSAGLCQVQHSSTTHKKDRVRWPTRVVKPAMCSTVQLRTLDRGRGEGATRPSPMLCRNPLSIIVSCCGDWLTRRTGSGRAIRGRQQGWEVAESQALRLHQAREQRQGFVGRAGWLEWSNEWYGPMLCQVQISHSSSMRCAMSPHACTPDQRWAPMTTPSPRHRSSSEYDSRWHPVDHVNQFLAALRPGHNLPLRRCWRLGCG